MYNSHKFFWGGRLMKKIFTCTNISSNNPNPVYISSNEQLEQIPENDIKLRCYVDDFFIAVKELKSKSKKIKYYVRIRENVTIENYDNLFDVFKDLRDYIKNIDCLELELSSIVKNRDFEKLITFLQCVNSNLQFVLKLGNLEVFNVEQLQSLKKLNSNLDTTIKINQTYQGKYSENNEYDNLYTFDDLIKIKKKIDEIIKKIPVDYNDVERILFIYKYLGKKIKYDKNIANLNYDERETHDSNSIYDILFENKGVCSSIAVTFRALMDAIGIDCQVIMSEEHEWNIVKINGYWYHLDLTWDLYNIKYNTPLNFFLKSEKQMSANEYHQIYTYYAEENEIAKRSLSLKNM
ncbi:MAG: hypothetical protein E7163_00140 [Firmicutes bacterium]|nr:hypothetical protein [Bacillota bacterium]